MNRFSSKSNIIADKPCLIQKLKAIKLPRLVSSFSVTFVTQIARKKKKLHAKNLVMYWIRMIHSEVDTLDKVNNENIISVIALVL